MSARPEIPADDAVNIEINGQPCQARKGAMIIEVTDDLGISVPRFCYHKKLSIAANCRMCMVEVEKVPKPLPACATPVAEGMKIFTQSDIATDGQRSVMEFLLINHPLDCPICDQGGECELQDLALGYGRDVSRFTENKRVVVDKNIGPLIATDMTRCIHCTRCIRMLCEVAGKMELGATGRGEGMEIGTYIEKSLESELSGNVIDVCPVGALTSKPFRFKARAWELEQHATVAPHDCVGSNLFVHTRRGEVMRVAPRENEDINEVWLSDRDRFAYEGLYNEDRLQAPMVKVDGKWQTVDWETGLQAAVDAIQAVIDGHGADQMGVLVSPTATLEEMSLLQAVARSIGVNNIDHRLRQVDFSDQDKAPLCPTLGQAVASLESIDAALVIGANPRKDQPIIGHRLRKAAMKGAKVSFVNPVDYEFLFDVHAACITSPSDMVSALVAVASCFPGSGIDASDAVKSAIASASPDDTQRSIAQALKDGDNATVLLGNAAMAHPQYSTLKALAGIIASASGATLGIMTDAGNSVGGWLAGALPHRGPAGQTVSSVGLDVLAMLDAPRKGYLLFAVEPELDCADAALANAAMQAAGVVVSITPFASESMKAHADVLLPIAPFTETSGTFVNTEGRWQSFSGVASPLGDSRPGWKVLRVLANQFGLDGFEQNSSEDVRDVLREQCGSIRLDNAQAAGAVAAAMTDSGLQRIGDVAIHGSDALVRRAASLQVTPDADVAATARLNAATANTAHVEEGASVTLKQGAASTRVIVEISERVPDNCVWLQSGTPVAASLGAAFGSISIERA